jgi:hypothetical protein
MRTVIDYLSEHRLAVLLVVLLAVLVVGPILWLETSTIH